MRGRIAYLEPLETRRLLAHTPQLLFSINNEPSGAEVVSVLDSFDDAAALFRNQFIDVDASARLPDEPPPASAEEILAGDADRDGTVNFSDFLTLSANFGNVDAVWADGDFTGDGAVDVADLLLFSHNFGMTA